jgi:hypothetical protein
MTMEEEEEKEKEEEEEEEEEEDKKDEKGHPTPAFRSKFQCHKEDADPIQSRRQDNQKQLCHKVHKKGLAPCSSLASSEPAATTGSMPMSKFTTSVQVESELSLSPFSGERRQDGKGGGIAG